jgi:hypothetical protein
MKISYSFSGPSSLWRPFGLQTVWCAWLLVAAPNLFATGEKLFPSPEAAVTALKAATAVRDTNALHEIFGPAARALVSADVVEATNEFAAFARHLNEKTELAQESDTKDILKLGAGGWPFPIPLVRQSDGWGFDTEAGKEEILNRRIGRNELNAISVCQAYVSAQREYATIDRNGDEVLEYAQHLRSTPGTHDGLYWSQKTGDELSPLGPLVAQARGEGYQHQTKILTDVQSPYQGYYFKILTRQGRHAAGGKYSYIINGHMIAGFGLVAWPAQWGNSGIMTFIINQQGKVYQKNLGAKTASTAQAMAIYDPDDTWAPTNGN